MQIIVWTDTGGEVLMEIPHARFIEVEVDGETLFGLDDKGPNLANLTRLEDPVTGDVAYVRPGSDE
jgi:hypothetical protein